MSVLPTLDLDFIRAQRCIAIVRGTSTAHFDETARTLVSSGVRMLEFPLTTPGVLDALQSVAEEHTGSAYVGAGSVTTMAGARAAHAAGAQFLVTPNFDSAVVKYARSVNIPVFAGALTPTEIHAAWAAGATAVKVFPASLGGPGYIRELRNGPYPEIPLIPTGGVAIADVPAFLAAGALALGMGSALLGSATDGGAQSALRVRVADFHSKARC
ncbi:MAG: bifunctional 4-hydroxy-2-oxoglutarate aldolase/2-dehydro-3-deoxy-phosphogluconate aldolase [Mycobacterium sp.]